MSHLFVLILLALPLAAQAIVIDNGIPMGTVGHWSVDVLTGGATQSAVFTTQIPTSGAVVTENVVSSYRVFVDPGIDGQGFELQGFEPIIDIFNNNRVSSSGTFVGANGNTIHWEAISRIEPGTKHLATGTRFLVTPGSRSVLCAFPNTSTETSKDPMRPTRRRTPLRPPRAMFFKS